MRRRSLTIRKLASSYAGSRLSERAKDTIEVLQKVIGTSRMEVQLKGVVLSSNYVWSVESEESPLRYGDVVVRSMAIVS